MASTSAMETPTKNKEDDATREDGGGDSAATTPLSASAAASSTLGNVSTADAEELTRFQCRCGKVRVQSLRHGYTNLKQHVLVKHRDWLIECADEVAVTPPSSPRRARKPSSATKSKLPTQKDEKTPKKRRISAMSSLSNGSGGDDASVRGDDEPDRAEVQADGAYDDHDEGSTEDDQEYAPAPPRPTTATTDGASTVKKREDYISWDDYFMSVAFLSAMRSKDPGTQVGACIVNKEKKIVGIGYNGFPNGCSDDVLPWARSHENPLETKYPFVCHAGDERDPQQELVRSQGLHDLRRSVPVQRVCQAHYSERHREHCLLLRQVPRRLEVCRLEKALGHGWRQVPSASLDENESHNRLLLSIVRGGVTD
ncbi:hypothetical protein PINS_up001442 [Pythium insidiosum]|nr:hypothetical protein PINS_up001442 [Pythium insidiosum]